MEKVEHVRIRRDMKASELVGEMGKSGVMGAGKIAKAARIFKKMIDDKECIVFLGLAGAMVPGGMREIVVDVLRRGYVDVLVTTGANLTHDLIEALGGEHCKGSEHADDSELNNKGIDRIYDVFMQNKAYEMLEKFFREVYPKLPREMNTREFLYEIGSYVEDKDSILRVCHEKNIPIFCPAISDSGIGLMIWGNLVKGGNVPKLRVDAFDDLREMMNITWSDKKCGVFYVGGGVPKNFIQQAMQFSNKQFGAEYGVQITMDRPEHGGSSGAPLREGVSWGKMNAKGEHVTVICDSTIALPLIYSAVVD